MLLLYIFINHISRFRQAALTASATFLTNVNNAITDDKTMIALPKPCRNYILPAIIRLDRMIQNAFVFGTNIPGLSTFADIDGKKAITTRPAHRHDAG